MAATHQSLFSFDVFVGRVHFDESQLKDMIVEPAVAVRFLDFPTLLIHRNAEKDPNDKKLSASEPLLQSEGNTLTYCLNKGKSCLFKMDLDSLHTHLCSAPLYIMLLDVRNTVPKLMGSLLISLAKLTESIKLSVEKHYTWTPAACGEKMIKPLLNLMGDKIGTISLACKIVCLGANLIPHITEREVCDVGTSYQNPNITESTRTKGNGTNEIQPPCPENLTADISSRPVCIEDQQTEVVQSKISEPKNVHVVTASTQTEHVKTKDKSLVAEVAFCEEWSMFCPPPLFYSSSEKTARQHAESYRMVDAAMENIQMVNLNSIDSDNDEESVEMEGVYQIRKPRQDGQERLFSNSVTQPSQTVPSVSGDGIRQLPLLNALLFELSHLSGQMQQPLSVHPNLASLYISTKEHSPKPASGKIFKTEALKRVASPVQRTVQSHSPTHRHRDSLISLNKDSVFEKKHQEKSHPKRKLKYGLTHSFHLRLKQIKPGVTKRHMCMEQYKTTQSEPQSSGKPKPTHPSSNQNFSRSLKESAKTMQNSFESDCVLPELKLCQQKDKCCRKKLTMQNRSLSKSLTDEDFCDKKENKVHVHVPTLLSHDFDHNANDSVSKKQRSSSYLIETSSHLRSDDRDGRLSGISHTSDSSHGSPEPDEYLDDFTSLDPTDGSPNPLSSPEPYRPQRTHVSSSNSSSGICSRENKSHPVPVKAQSSPKRSLKSTHTIRSHLQTSLNSTSSEDSRSSFSNSFQHWKRNSHSSLSKSLSNSRIFESPQCDNVSLENVSKREQPLDNFLPSNNSVLESVSSSESEEGQDDLGSLGFQNKYQPISELVVNKLPGYTL